MLLGKTSGSAIGKPISQIEFAVMMVRFTSSVLSRWTIIFILIAVMNSFNSLGRIDAARATGAQGAEADAGAGAGARAGTGSQVVHSEKFRLPALSLAPGDVVDRWFRAEMPPGHIALRSLDAKLVDEHGTLIPISETYLYRWQMERYYIIRGSSGTGIDSRPILVPNAGVCQHGTLSQWFGLGSETAQSNITVPPPYGIVVGDPEAVPFGFEEAWFLDVHAIDTRGAVSSRGCMECFCELYNVSTDVYGTELPEDYEGGRFCCHSGTHCPVRVGFRAARRELFLEYTVTWVDMTKEIVPARVYYLDVTDSRASVSEQPECRMEYTVDKCSSTSNKSEGAQACVHTAESVAFIPDGGDVIFAVAHQRMGGLGASLYSENGRRICSSFPIYGDATGTIGNGAGYVVGMEPCYPEIGKVQIKDGEKLRITSSYDSEEQHTGASGVFYLLVADSQSKQGRGGFFSKMLLGSLTIVAAISFAVITVSRFHMLRAPRNSTSTGSGEYRPIT